MSGRRRRRDAGFTYLSVLAAVVVVGIALSGASQYWRILLQREREAELLFRGDQIRRAIEAYVRATPAGRTDSYPKRMEDLLVDPRFPDIRKYLRKRYPDPMAPDGEWKSILGPDGALRGVASASKKKPLKTGNFPPAYAHFQKAETYADWKFSFHQAAAPAAQPEPLTEEGISN